MKRIYQNYSILRTVAAVFVIVATTMSAIGQSSLPSGAGSRDQSGHSHTGHPKVKLAPSFAWKVLPPLGLHEESSIDTLLIDYCRQSVPSAVSDAWATTGNLGAEGMNMIFYQRAPMSDFFFRDALSAWMPSLSKTKFYNTRIPMTLLSFNSSGGRETAQERLQTVFSGNINARAQIGANLDYLYSKGSYSNQAVKDLNWGGSGSYMGDRYEFQGIFNHWNMVNKENGGITDMLYITDPAEVQAGITKVDPKSIPTRLRDAHTRVSGDELWLNNRYKVGYWHEEQVNDTTVKRTYIPVSSFIYTLKYNSAKHTFINSSNQDNFFENTYYNPNSTRDQTRYWSLSNTFGISMLEGFHKYAKFGLAAYITHQVRHYELPDDTVDMSASESLTPLPEGLAFEPKKTEQLAFVGAQLTKQKGSILTYEATAELGIIGPVAGDIKVDGHVSTRFPLLKDSVKIKAFGSFHNEEAPYLMKNYRSNHFVWNNDFGKIRNLTFGGELNVPRTGTLFRASVSNIQNHIYFGASGMPCQEGGSVQVLSLSLQQNFKVGILHWDNSVTYQTTSNDAVIPLPQLAIYSNLYLLGRIATLKFQLGVDCDYYTKYYAPAYSPSLANFNNQREMKLGNYPFCNVYLNMKLSKTRFYIMYSHVNQGLFGGSNYFSIPYYPLNPRRMQIGISVDFAN